MSSSRTARGSKRRCAKCKRLLPLDVFNVDRSKPGGRRYDCRACRSRHTRRTMHDPCLYLLQVPGGEIKIGRSRNLPMRMSQARTWCPHGYKLLCVVEGAADLEEPLHGLFAECRLQGEWFYPSEGLLALIDELRESEDDRISRLIIEEHISDRGK